MHDLERWVEELENSAEAASLLQIVGKGVQPFDHDRVLRCPWLRWRIARDKQSRKPNDAPPGMFLMQDWGNECQSMGSAVREIHRAFAHPRDRTLRKLVQSGWADAIKRDGWLVSNAVWGLRRPQTAMQAEKCGYLGAKLHKRAFLLWGQLAVRLCEQSAGNFTLVVAGGWASCKGCFLDGRHSEKFSFYMSCWKQWATRGPEAVKAWPPELEQARIEKCRGTVVRIKHPCTWAQRESADAWTTQGPRRN